VSPGIGFSKRLSDIPTRNGGRYTTFDFGFFQDVTDHTIPYFMPKVTYRQHFGSLFHGELGVGIGVSMEYPITYGRENGQDFSRVEGGRIFFPLQFSGGLGSTVFGTPVTIKYAHQMNVMSIFGGSLFQAFEDLDGNNRLYPGTFSQISLVLDL
jgi:hypothetical protein